MTLAMFECFIAATETLNFTVAAQNIHITQPAFSRNIAALEEELGFSLFLRSKQNGLRITPAGLELYNGLKKLGREFRLILKHAEQINRGEEGQLVISILNGTCMDNESMAVIHKFQEKYPRVEITMLSYPYERMMESIETGESDICFALEATVEEREDLLFDSVFEVENYLAVPSRLQCDDTKEYSLKEFQNEYFLLSEDAPAINSLLIKSCRNAGFEPKTRIAPDFETKMLWVEFGKGIAINSKEHYMQNSNYVKFVKIKEIPKDRYAIVWKKDNYNPVIALFYSMYDEIMSS
ncbi:MAG: LysR family transcriptional regulator [Eubacterium sp.]|nr:LysR family transcriptional regulator [Eubacterium sp.]